MAEQKIIDDYENALMSLAVSEMIEQYGKELEEKYGDAEDVSPSPEAEEKFEKELDRAYRNGQMLSFRAKIMKFGRYAVTACAAVIIVFAVSVISVDALRFRFLEWLTNIHGSHSSLNISKDDNKYNNMIHADYMPSEYKLINYNNDGDIVDINYSNNINEINIHVYLYDYTFNTDSDDISSEEVYINENKGQYQKKESISTLYWYDDNNSYWISTNDPHISKDEFIKISRSVS